MPGRDWKTQLTKTETRLGLVFFPLYFFLFPHVNAWVQQRVMGDGEVLVAEANVVYYAVLFGLCLLLFWKFLRQDLLGLLDYAPENAYWVVAGLLIAGGLRVLFSLLPLPADPILEQYLAQFHAAPAPTLALVLLLIPLVEETLYRGLLYGLLRQFHKPLALCGCVLFYALACVWRYALEAGDPAYLLLTLLYLPLSAAVTLCYEKGGSVWATTVLHGGVNALVMVMAVG